VNDQASGRAKPPRRGPLSRITNAAAGAIPVNDIVERVDVNELVERIDVNQLVQRLDLDALLGQVDVNAMVGRVDPEALLAKVDPNALLDRVEPDRLLDRVDPDRLLDRVDANALLDRVDPDRLLDRVDVNRVLDRVDPDRLLDRVDPDRLMDRVDINGLMDRVDIREVVDRAGVAEIVGEGTGQVAGSVLDAVRRQVVAVDEISGRVAHRIVGKDPKKVPEGPAALLAGGAESGSVSEDRKGRGVIQGHYAGPVARLLAFIADVFAMLGIYTGASAAVTFFVTGILGIDLSQWNYAALAGVILLAVWAFAYYFIALSLVGRTVGMGLVGLMVVSADGSTLSGRQTFVRTIAMPLSFLFFGIGLLGIAFGRTRQAWHDKIAKTAVVYDWGERAAALPAPLTQWINRHS
jgi:uncharacterized RDD family membrane protein YckC